MSAPRELTLAGASLNYRIGKGKEMKMIAGLLMCSMLLVGCATHFYVPPSGDATSYKSMGECRLAHPDTENRCVDRSQYTGASLGTIGTILHGLQVILMAIGLGLR